MRPARNILPIELENVVLNLVSLILDTYHKINYTYLYLMITILYLNYRYY